MKSEIKGNLFTSTQASILLGMNVQTLREWQRKEYIPLPNTGGWQRYRTQDIFAFFAMDWLLDTGMTHEMASSIAMHAYPIYEGIVRDTKKAIPADKQTFRLLVSTSPNLDPTFQPITDIAELTRTLEEETKWCTARFLIDFRGLLNDMKFALDCYTFTEGSRMFWKSDAGQGQ